MSAFRTVTRVGTENVAAAAILWRYRERVQMTVVAKAAFAVLPGGSLELLAPPPLLDRERLDVRAPDHALEPSDLVPYSPKVDVTVIADRRPGESARLRLMRGDEPIIETASPEGPSAFAPLSTASPLRAARLGALDPSFLRAQAIDVPDHLDWSYFQAAPAAQQVAHLDEGDLLELQGVSAPSGAAAIRVPKLGGSLHVHGLRALKGDVLEDDLSLAALHLDLRIGRMTLVARAMFSVDLTDDLRAILITVTAEASSSAARAVTPRASSGTVALESNEEARTRVDHNRTVSIAADAPRDALSPFPLAQPCRARTRPASFIPGAPWSPVVASRVEPPLDAQSTTLADVPAPATPFAAFAEPSRSVPMAPLPLIAEPARAEPVTPPPLIAVPAPLQVAPALPPEMPAPARPEPPREAAPPAWSWASAPRAIPEPPAAAKPARPAAIDIRDEVYGAFRRGRRAR